MTESFFDSSIVPTDRSATLKAYYAQYLKEVRGLSDSSVKHYIDALNNITRKLLSMSLVRSDIYEIADMERLTRVRDVLYADPEFTALNERGRRMYSAGLNNYIRFASGEDYTDLFDRMTAMDIPIEPENPVTIQETVWKRSGILRTQALVWANYKCEIDNGHKTFLAEANNKPYMESHHAIPMRQQPHFENSLDVYANLVCLCPICHRKIHYGIKAERNELICSIYHDRAERLAKSGIRLSREEFIDMASNAAE